MPVLAAIIKIVKTHSDYCIRFLTILAVFLISSHFFLASQGDLLLHVHMYNTYVQCKFCILLYIALDLHVYNYVCIFVPFLTVAKDPVSYQGYQQTKGRQYNSVFSAQERQVCQNLEKLHVELNNEFKFFLLSFQTFPLESCRVKPRNSTIIYDESCVF